MWPKADSCDSRDHLRPAGVEFHPGKEGLVRENQKWSGTTYFFARWFSPVSIVGKSCPQVCSSLHGWDTAAPLVLSPALPVFLAELFLFLPPASSRSVLFPVEWWDCFILRISSAFLASFSAWGNTNPGTERLIIVFWVKRERIGDWAEIDEFPAVRGEK